MVLSDSKTNGIREPLTKRSSSNFNAIGIVSFRVTRSNAVYGLDGGKLSVNVQWVGLLYNSTYAECLDIIHRKLVPAEVKKSILKHASMAVAEEALARGGWQKYKKRQFSRSIDGSLIA